MWCLFINGGKNPPINYLFYNVVIHQKSLCPILFLSQFCNFFHSFICKSRSTWNTPYGDNTYFLDLALIRVWAVPSCILAAAHPGEAGFKKNFFFNLPVSRSQQRLLGEGGRNPKGLGPDWGTIWVALEWNTKPLGAGQERVRVHTLEIFLSPASRVPQFGIWTGAGGGPTQRPPFLGVTPPHLSRRGPTEQGMWFFPLPPKRPTLPIRAVKVSLIVLCLPITGTLKFKFEKISPSKTPLARVWDWRAQISQAEADGKRGRESERRGRGGGWFLHGPIPHPARYPSSGNAKGAGGCEGAPEPLSPGITAPCTPRSARAPAPPPPSRRREEKGEGSERYRLCRRPHPTPRLRPPSPRARGYLSAQKGRGLGPSEWPARDLSPPPTPHPTHTPPSHLPPSSRSAPWPRWLRRPRRPLPPP